MSIMIALVIVALVVVIVADVVVVVVVEGILQMSNIHSEFLEFQ